MALQQVEGGFVGTCWCGTKRAWFSDEGLASCGGYGVVYCYCGGDFCVCHWHGDVECTGCPDCEPADDWDDE